MLVFVVTSINRGLFFTVLSDLFINLSAGWFGAGLIIPTFSGEIVSVNFIVLFSDIFLGIIFLITSYQLRKI